MRFAALPDDGIGPEISVHRFEAAAKAGFRGVEMLAPYEVPAKATCQRLAIEAINQHDIPGYCLRTQEQAAAWT